MFSQSYGPADGTSWGGCRQRLLIRIILNFGKIEVLEGYFSEGTFVFGLLGGVFARKGANEYVGGLKLGLIGFVFLEAEGDLVFISLCGKQAWVDCGYMEIGFVLHKKGGDL